MIHKWSERMKLDEAAQENLNPGLWCSKKERAGIDESGCCCVLDVLKKKSAFSFSLSLVVHSIGLSLYDFFKFIFQFADHWSWSVCGWLLNPNAGRSLHFFFNEKKLVFQSDKKKNDELEHPEADETAGLFVLCVFFLKIQFSVNTILLIVAVELRIRRAGCGWCDMDAVWHRSNGSGGHDPFAGSVSGQDGAATRAAGSSSSSSSTSAQSVPGETKQFTSVQRSG